MFGYRMTERGKSAFMKAIEAEKTPSFTGIVNGECKGDLWVEDVEIPEIVIAHSYCVGGFSILGHTEQSGIQKLYDFLTQELFGWLKQNGMDYFEFSVEDSDVEQKLLEMFHDQDIDSEVEYSYRIMDTMNRMQAPDSYHILPINQAFIDMMLDGVYSNTQMVNEKILTSWFSYQEFLTRSLGYAVLHKNRIVSVIVGTARFHDVIAINIETEEPHWERGLAKLLTGYFVNECMNRGLVPQWDCVESNPVSMHTAESCGFEMIRSRNIYWLIVN